MDTSSAANMTGLFYNCYNLESLDLINFDTSSVTLMKWMFFHCYSLKSIKFPEIFNTSKVENMYSMFSGCKSLTYLNLSSFDTLKITDMSFMFQNCLSLKYLDIPNFNPSNLKSMIQMFYNMSSLIYLNIFSLDINDETKTNLSFKTLPSNVKICSNKTNMQNYLLNISRNYDCDDICFQENNTDCFKICQYYYYLNESNDYICTKSEDCVDNYNKLIKEKSQCIDKCENDNTYIYEYANICYEECPEKTIKSSKNNYLCLGEKNIFDNEIADDDIHKVIVNNIINNYDISKGEEIIYPREDNFFFHITNTENELELLKGKNNNTNIFSIIDLGTCGNLLKDYYNINENTSLILIKYEKIANISSQRSLQYEIYEPYNKTKLNLSVCQNENLNIDIYIPVILSEKIQNLYNEVKEMGYDLFDINSPFYNDICTPYKTTNGTDVILTDRVNSYYYNDDTTCQSNCKFSEYLMESEYLKCECDMKNSEINTNNAKSFNAKSIYQSFYNVLKYSNYKVLKCYKLIMTMNTFTKNIGSIISLIFFFAFFIFLLFYSAKGINSLKIDFLKILITSNENNIQSKNITNIKLTKQRKIYNKPSIFKKSNFYKSSTSINKNSSSRKINNKINNNKNIKTKINQKFSKKNPPKKNNIFIFIKNKKFVKMPKKEVNIFNISKSKNNKSNSFSKLSLANKNQTFKNSQLKKNEFDNNELNNLEYNIAKKLDKRNFCQIYWSLLKREHSIIFTFITRDDHNIIFVKYSRFFFLLCNDMAMNVFFFKDETMHEMFLDYGKYNLIQQVPQIIYSAAVSKLIEILLCYLSLSDYHYYQAKDFKNLSKNNLMRILKCIKNKIAIFFIFTFLFFIFYWYFITCFCAVYQNTQIAFIKDSLFSFLLSNSIPIVIYLIPSLLRIISLKAYKSNLVCVYKLSNIIPCF